MINIFLIFLSCFIKYNTIFVMTFIILQVLVVPKIFISAMTKSILNENRKHYFNGITFKASVEYEPICCALPSTASNLDDWIFGSLYSKYGYAQCKQTKLKGFLVQQQNQLKQNRITSPFLCRSVSRRNTII